MNSSQKADAQILSDLGVNSEITYNVRNGKRIVTVVLSTTPKGDANKIRAKVESIVRTNFSRVDELKSDMHTSSAIRGDSSRAL